MSYITDGRKAENTDCTGGNLDGGHGSIRPLTAASGNNHFLFDANIFEAAPEHLFDPRQLATNGLLTGEASGRGTAWFLRHRELYLVLRHFRRGGLMEKIMVDRYWGNNPVTSRAWREWYLLLRLYRQGLPVPRPVAARVVKSHFFLRADLITAAIPGACALADRLATAPLADQLWAQIGATIALFHRQGVWHPDLNARNILIGHQGRVFLIDFEQSRFRPELGPAQNLKRLQRSLSKIRKNSDRFYYTEATDWPVFLSGYREAIIS